MNNLEKINKCIEDAEFLVDECNELSEELAQLNKGNSAKECADKAKYYALKVAQELRLLKHFAPDNFLQS